MPLETARSVLPKTCHPERSAAWLAMEVWEKWRRSVRGVPGGAQSKSLS